MNSLILSSVNGSGHLFLIIAEKTAYFGEDVKKSRMIFAGLRKKDQVVDLIAYLKTLK